MQELSEASLWPGTPEYKKKYGSNMPDDKDGSRHKIEKSAGVVRATRKYDSESGESEEPTKNREDAAAAPVKRGRGRPPGKYGSYKKKVKESMDILESLETEEEILEFINSLDEESFNELEQYLEEEQDDVMEGQLRNFSPHSDLAGRGRLSGYNKTAAGKKREFDRETERLKDKIKFTKSQGGIAGPKGKLPEEVEPVKEAKEDPKDIAKKHMMKSYGPGSISFRKSSNGGHHIQHEDDHGDTHSHQYDPKTGKVDFKSVVRSSYYEEVEPVKEEQIDESVNRYAAFISKENK